MIWGCCLFTETSIYKYSITWSFLKGGILQLKKRLKPGYFQPTLWVGGFHRKCFLLSKKISLWSKEIIRNNTLQKINIYPTLGSQENHLQNAKHGGICVGSLEGSTSHMLHPLRVHQNINHLRVLLPSWYNIPKMSCHLTESGSHPSS